MSGIYIKGMATPTEGTAEAIIIHSDGTVGFLHEDDYRQLKAVPVPDHGRLIDADALPWIEGKDEQDKPVYLLLKYQVDLLPTIIPADPAEEEE